MKVEMYSWLWVVVVGIESEGGQRDCEKVALGRQGPWEETNDVRLSSQTTRLQQGYYAPLA